MPALLRKLLPALTLAAMLTACESVDDDRTGYGGLLLVTDVLGDLHAYDLACPFEVRPNVRVSIPEGELFARCPSCGSTFDVFQNRGNPISGPAQERGYALRRYSVVSGGATEYRVVTR